MKPINPSAGWSRDDSVRLRKFKPRIAADSRWWAIGSIGPDRIDWIDRIDLNPVFFFSRWWAIGLIGSDRIDQISALFLFKQKNVKLIRRIIMNYLLNPMTDPSGYPMNHPINLTDNPIGLKSAYLTDGSSDIRIDQIRIAPLVIMI